MDFSSAQQMLTPQRPGRAHSKREWTRINTARQSRNQKQQMTTAKYAEYAKTCLFRMNLCAPIFLPESLRSLASVIFSASLPLRNPCSVSLQNQHAPRGF